MAEYVELVVRQNGLGESHHLAMVFVRSEDVHSDGSDILREGHHQIFAYGVDGRIRHLCELLAEIVEKQLRPLGQCSQLRVISHG